MSDRFQPPERSVSKPFWDATREQRLVLQWCDRCDAAVHYPRELCPACGRTDLSWRPVSGRGTVYAVSAMPHIVALVELDEGGRLMTNVVGCGPDEVTVGMAVQVTWEALDDGRHLPLFEPAT